MNMSILAKLTKGIQETMDSFVSQMRSNAGMHFCRLPGPYLSYITFQSALQEALSIYFQARKEWADGKQRGIAVSMMKTARAGLEVRSSITSKGIPEAINSSSSPLYVLRGELVSEPTATAMAPHAPTHTCAMDWRIQFPVHAVLSVQLDRGGSVPGWPFCATCSRTARSERLSVHTA